MSKKQAPFKHGDGTGCWTKNCSRRMSVDEARKNMNTAYDAYLGTMGDAFTALLRGEEPGELSDDSKKALKEYHSAEKGFRQSVKQEKANRLASEKAKGQRVLDRNDPRFIATLEAKGY